MSSKPLSKRPPGMPPGPPRRDKTLTNTLNRFSQSGRPERHIEEKKPALGQLANLIYDPEVTEVLVNDTRSVFLEKNGKLVSSGFHFAAEEDLKQWTYDLLDSLRLPPLSDQNPTIDHTLPNGARLHIIGPPISASGISISIRKFPRRFSLKDLFAAQAIDERLYIFLKLAAQGQLNLLISGGTGSGKTSLLNALCASIPKGERIITIEDTREIYVPHSNSVHLITQPKISGQKGISARDLIAHGLRMRPDRLIMGECRGPEAIDVLQTMNTGHDGSMTTIHADSTRDALSRLETLCMMSGIEIPLPVIRKQIADGIDVIVQLKRFRSGHRQIIQVSEVSGMEGNTITLQDVFVGTEKDVQMTGLVPKLVDLLREQGLEFPVNYFSK